MSSSNVQIISRSGTRWARIDNAGGSDVGAEITRLLEAHWEPGGIDLFLAPGRYLLESPILVRQRNVGIQGYTYGFGIADPEGTRLEGVEPKTQLVLAPACRDAIQISSGETSGVSGFVLRNVTIAGQNGRVGVRPDITPQQNGIRVMPNTPIWSFVVDYCQFVHLTHGIVNEHPESTMDVWSITDNWISECNTAIKLHASLFASVISRNGFHDMSGTVLELRSSNRTDAQTKEVVISDNTGWNPGRLVFDLDGFRGGVVSDNAFMFSHGHVQEFARLTACHLTHLSGNTFVADSDEARAHYTTGPGDVTGPWLSGETPATGDILTIVGCSDLTVTGNTLLGLDPDRAPIRVGAAESGERSRHNNLTLNKVLPSAGFEGRPQIELSEGSESTLVLLPMAVGQAAAVAVRDHGVGNQVCALPAAVTR